MRRSSLPTLSMAFAILSTWISPSGSEFTAIVADSPAAVGAPSARSTVNADEQRAVYEIMAATGNGWAASISDVCREGWHGIECSSDGDGVRHVVSLSFGTLSDDAGFPACDRQSSSLSPALVRLPHLRTLFFYRCFSDNPQRISTFLGELGSSLRTLVLRENGLVGPIPPELGKLSSLRVLDLHGNHLSSSIPPSLAALTHLQLLDLGENSLTGAIPSLKLPFLKVLDLSNNLLGGQIPPTLGSCPLLIKVDLSRNRLGGRIPESFRALQDLILLDLGRNRLTGPMPGSLRSLTSLRTLILSGNYMGPAAIPSGAFASMKGIMTLALSSMGLQGPIPESIGLIAGLRVLHLDGNNLNGSIPSSFRNLVQLSELRLDNNQLTGPLPFDRQMLWRMGRKLSVSNNSGLCYDAISGGDYLPGIGPLRGGNDTNHAIGSITHGGVRSTAVAAASGVGPGGRLVRHPAISGGHGQHSYYGSSASARGCSITLLHLLLLAMGILLPALPVSQTPLW